MADPWAFGWTQLLTIIGFIITITIAVGGFRTFGRWKREKIEEIRIATAVEALSFVYESKFIFDHIRSPASYSYEWADMPADICPEERRPAHGTFYAILKRIQANNEFFDRAWKIQVRCTALFGSSVEEVFMLLHRARREIEVSAGMLMRDPQPTVMTEDNRDLWNQMRADVWEAYGRMAKEGDRVGRQLTDFTMKMQKLCRPIIDREYGRVRRKGLFGRVADRPGMSHKVEAAPHKPGN